MAITRAQQAKQMLRKGGRIGLKGGADAATESFGASVGYGDGRPGGSTGRKGSVDISPSGNVTFNPGGKDSPVERDTGLERERLRNVDKLKFFKDTKPKVKTPPLGVLSFFKTPFQKLSNFTTAKNRKYFENVIRSGNIPGLNFATLDDLTPQELEDKYQDYMSERLAGNIDAYGNPLRRGDDGPDPIPFIPKSIEEPIEEVAEYVNPLSLLTPRIAGSRFLGTEFEDEDDTEFAADGGRIGLKGGADAATESFSKSAGSSRPGRKGSVSVSPSGNVTFNPGGRDEGPDDRSTFEQTVNQRRITNEAKRQKPSNLENMFRTASELNYLRNLIRMNPQGLGLSYFTNKIGNFLFPPAGAAEFDMEAFQKAGAEKGFFGMNDELEAMQKYYDFAQKQKAMGKDPAAIRDSANIGSALYGIDMDLVPETFLQTEEDFAKQKAPISFFNLGGRAGYAMGDTAEQNAIQASGIMDLPLNENPAGVTELDLRESGGFIPPVGVKEKADDIPAMLSNNEFVFTADAVRGMGDGNVNLGAQRMYDMMKKLENGGRV